MEEVAATGSKTMSLLLLSSRLMRETRLEICLDMDAVMGSNCTSWRMGAVGEWSWVADGAPLSSSCHWCSCQHWYFQCHCPNLTRSHQPPQTMPMIPLATMAMPQKPRLLSLPHPAPRNIMVANYQTDWLLLPLLTTPPMTWIGGAEAAMHL